jgi:hypothetical protein
MKTVLIVDDKRVQLKTLGRSLAIDIVLTD